MRSLKSVTITHTQTRHTRGTTHFRMAVVATLRIRCHRQRIVRRVASRFGKLRSNGVCRPPENNPSSSQHTPAAWRTLPAGIWALGIGSLFMDTSSEMNHSLLPIFMVTALGASKMPVGENEGIAEATAAVLKVFSGTLSDYLGKRKFLMILGYGLAAFTYPIFPLAGSIGWVFSARVVDRIGNGIRGAPRDAVVADIAPAHMRGAAYGRRQALDSIGALLGPLLAVGFMIWLADDIRTVMWIAVVPAFIAVALLMIYVREPERAHRS